MLATHRVKDADGKTVGFIVNNQFYNEKIIRENIDYIDNLTLLKSGIIRAKKELTEISYKKAVIDKELIKLNTEKPFVRDIQKDLLAWKNKPGHRVLQLRGSRQIGKTSELKKFAYKNYDYVVYIDLSEHKDFAEKILTEGINELTLDKICIRLGLPHFVNNKKTILIIDEIQQSKLIFNSIRKFEDILDCDIIITGSYLGRVLGHREWFLPAGTLEYVYMYPMNFKEFCRIFKCEKILENIDLYGNSEYEHYEKLEQLYSIYRQIGGYPDVVREFLNTRNIDNCYGIIERILDTFKEESRVYFKQAREVEIFNNVYRAALSDMCSERRGTGKNTVETITEIAKVNTNLMINKSEIANAVTWVLYAGIIGSCNLAIDGDMRNIAPDRRYYFCDCGIVSYLASKSLIAKSTLEGLITETFVYNELHRMFTVPYNNRKVLEDEVCFSTYESYELDFMIADKNNIIYGIEVKTKDGDPKSLKVYLSKKLIDKGYVVKPTKGGRGDKFDTIPIYTVGCRFPYN